MSDIAFSDCSSGHRVLTFLFYIQSRCFFCHRCRACPSISLSELFCPPKAMRHWVSRLKFTIYLSLCALTKVRTGWTGSIFYSVAIGLMLKLTASAMQQKLVGENLSHLVKVRQFVGINSAFIKAMRLVLEKDGFGLAKVCILIGGPDWPVSDFPIPLV